MRKCNGCQEPLDVYEDSYECQHCAPEQELEEEVGGFRLCEACRFGEDVRHAHSLTRVHGRPRDYAYFVRESPKKTAKGARLVLGTYASARPGSLAMRDESIQSVLSLVHFDTEILPPADGNGLNSFKRIFFPNGRYQALVRHQGVVYYHINVPDLADPAQLTHFGCSDFLPRSVLFLEFALRAGNALVHCEKGQRRSPTIFLAWLMYHGSSLLRSMELIASEYEGDEDWGESYKRHRPLWIDGPLDQWQEHFPTMCRRWIGEHKSLLRQWKGAYDDLLNHKEEKKSAMRKQKAPKPPRSPSPMKNRKSVPPLPRSPQPSEIESSESSDLSEEIENDAPVPNRVTKKASTVQLAKSAAVSPPVPSSLLKKRKREASLEAEIPATNKRLRSLEEDLLGL